MTEQTSTLTLLLQKVKEIVNRDNIDADVPIGEMGVDSLTLIELILACDQIYPGANAAEADSLNQFTTLRELDGILATLSQEAAAASPALTQA